MIAKFKVPSFFAAALLLAACTEEYAPESNASPESIFAEACAGCHKAKDDIEEPTGKAVFFEFSEEEATVEYISKKVREGGMIMPKFPNISDDDLAGLSQFALEHSVVEKK